jgi:hypothetical protein
MAALLHPNTKATALCLFHVLPHELLLDLTASERRTIISVLSNGFESAAQLKFVVQSTLPEMQQLSEAGTRYSSEEERRYIYFHAKAAILDDDHVILGSHNFTIGSMVSCNEISIEFFPGYRIIPCTGIRSAMSEMQHTSLLKSSQKRSSRTTIVLIRGLALQANLESFHLTVLAFFPDFCNNMHEIRINMQKVS